jgi:hypothetical protein
LAHWAEFAEVNQNGSPFIAFDEGEPFDFYSFLKPLFSVFLLRLSVVDRSPVMQNTQQFNFSAAPVSGGGSCSEGHPQGLSG